MRIQQNILMLAHVLAYTASTEASIMLNLPLNFAYSDDLNDRYSDMYIEKKAAIEAMLDDTLETELPNGSNVTQVEVISFSQTLARRRRAGDDGGNAIAEVEIITNVVSVIATENEETDDSTFSETIAEIEDIIEESIERNGYFLIK